MSQYKKPKSSKSSKSPKTPKSPKSPGSLRRQSTFVRVALPDEVGGGFITLRANPNTDDAELKRQALAMVKSKRLSKAHVGIPPTIKTNTLQLQSSRLNAVISKRRAPRIERLVRSLTNETKTRKDKNFKLTFYPGKIGISWKENFVTQVVPGSQANSAGVCVGWRVLAVNGKSMPADGPSIARAIAETNNAPTDSGKNTQITFAPGQMRIKTRVVLRDLKTNASYNGFEAIITKTLDGNKYDISLLNTKTKTSIRGIHGVYLQLKQQEQYWRVVHPRGIKIRVAPEKRADVIGRSYYGTVVAGLQTGNWLHHQKGYSPIQGAHGKRFLLQDDFCRFGIMWPLAIVRKRIYIQICKNYESRRVDLDSILEAAAARQQELEEEDAKKKPAFKSKEWKKFWQRQNPEFAAYYRHIYSENKKKIKADLKMAKQRQSETVDEKDPIQDSPIMKPILPDIYGTPFEEDQEEIDPFSFETEFDGMEIKSNNHVEPPATIMEEDGLVDFLSM